MDEELKKLLEELKALLQQDIADDKKETEEQFAAVKKEFAAKQEALQQSINDLIAKGASLGGAGKFSAKAKSIGTQFTASKEFQDAAKNFSNVRTEFDLGVIDANGNPLVPKKRSDRMGILPVPVRLRDVMTVIPISDGAVEYILETGFINGAAARKDLNASAASTLTAVLKTAPVVTISTNMPISKNMAKDGRVVANYIDKRLMNALELKEDYELLNGSADGMVGFLNTANIQTFVPTVAADAKVGDTAVDLIRRAVTKSRIAQFPVEAVVLNPIDLEKIELTKGANGQYVVFYMPENGKSIWSIPIIETPAIPAGTFLLGAFNSASTLWDREQAVIEYANQHMDNFIKGTITVLVEERIVATVERPESFVKGTFPAVLPVA